MTYPRLTEPFVKVRVNGTMALEENYAKSHHLSIRLKELILQPAPRVGFFQLFLAKILLF